MANHYTKPSLIIYSDRKHYRTATAVSKHKEKLLQGNTLLQYRKRTNLLACKLHDSFYKLSLQSPNALQAQASLYKRLEGPGMPQECLSGSCLFERWLLLAVTLGDNNDTKRVAWCNRSMIEEITLVSMSMARFPRNTILHQGLREERHVCDKKPPPPPPTHINTQTQKLATVLGFP